MGESFPRQTRTSGARFGTSGRAVIIYSENLRTFGYDRIRRKMERSGWAAWMLESDDGRPGTAHAKHGKPKHRKAPTAT